MKPRLAPLALTLALALAPSLARADPPRAQEPDPKAMAVHLGEEALALYAKGRFADALDRFETAERVAHSPVFLLWMARSRRGLGALRAARALCERVVAEELPPGASAKWIAARDEAKAELEAIARRTPKVRVDARGAGPGEASILLDGAPIDPGVVVDVDPGDHVVSAVARGRAAVKRALHAEEGQPLVVVDLALDPAPELVSEPARATGSIVPGAVTLGVGLAGVAAGAATGIAGIVLAGQVKSSCVGDHCLATDESKAHTAEALGRASVGCLVAGGVVADVGVALIVARPGGPAAAARVEVSPLGARLVGRF